MISRITSLRRVPKISRTNRLGDHLGDRARRQVGDAAPSRCCRRPGSASCARAPGTGSPCRGNRDRSCPWRRRRAGPRRRGGWRQSRRLRTPRARPTGSPRRRSAWRAARGLRRRRASANTAPCCSDLAWLRARHDGTHYLTDWSVINLCACKTGRPQGAAHPADSAGFRNGARGRLRVPGARSPLAFSPWRRRQRRG